MPAVYSFKSIAEFFEEQGISSPAHNEDVWPYMFTMHYDPYYGKEFFVRLDHLPGRYFYRTKELGGYESLGPFEYNPDHPVDGQNKGITEADGPVFLPGSSSRAHEDVVSRLLTEKIEEGNLYVFDPNDRSPMLKAVKGPKITDKSGHDQNGLILYKADLEFENIDTDTTKLEEPKISTFKYLLSFLGFFKKELANYNKDMIEYNAKKELIKNVLFMAERRKEQIEREEKIPEIAKRREIVKEANAISDRFDKETKLMELPEDMADAVATLDNGFGWPNASFCKAEYIRKTSPEYLEKYETLKNYELQTAVDKKMLSDEASPGISEDLTKSICSPEAFLELTQDSNKTAEETKIDFQKYYSAIENLHFNTSPDKRQDDIMFLKELCAENVQTARDTFNVLGYDGTFNKRRFEGIDYQKSPDAVGPCTSNKVMGKFIGDNRARMLLSREIFNQIELKGNVTEQFSKEKAVCDTILKTCEEQKKQMQSTGREKNQTRNIVKHALGNDIQKEADQLSAENKKIGNKLFTCKTKDGFNNVVAMQIAKTLPLPNNTKIEDVANKIAKDDKIKVQLDELYKEVGDLKIAQSNNQIKDSDVQKSVLQLIAKTEQIIGGKDVKDKAPISEGKESQANNVQASENTNTVTSKEIKGHSI